jgi:hypothetical protein
MAEDTMRRIERTYQLAMDAARDAGDRNMRRGGRSDWDAGDYYVANETFAALWPMPVNKIERARSQSHKSTPAHEMHK